MASSGIILYVDHNSTYVRGRFDSSTYERFKKTLGYLPENSFWMVRKNSQEPNQTWKKNWDGHISTVCWNYSHCRCHIKKQGMHFPTGLLTTAVQFFKDNNIEFKRVDIRKTTPKTNRYELSDSVEFRDYQQNIINKIVGYDKKRGIDRGIIKMSTGSGKTFVGCGIIAKIGVSPAIFYVPSIDLLQQAKDEIERFVTENGKKVEVGMVGGGKQDIKDITVMTIQTAVRSLGGVWIKYDDEDLEEDNSGIQNKEDIKNLIKNSRLMICDEVQHWSSETCQIISDASEMCQYRFGMSATPWRDKGDDILIDGCFGRCITDINASFLIERGYLVKPTIYFSKISNMRGLGRKNYASIYKQAIVENEFRNSQIAELATSFKDIGRKVLILVRQIAHGKLLENIIPDSIFLYGDTSKKKRKIHLDKMREGKPQITISSQIFDEGIDCRPLDTLILAGSGRSPTRALQRIGRILRPYPGKKDAIAVDFMDTCKYMQSHSRKRLSIYRTEKEFDIRIEE